MAGYLDDGEGNHSSKRLCAVILIGSGVGLAWIAGLAALFCSSVNLEAIRAISGLVTTLVMAGGGLGVGGTIAENVQNMFVKNN